VKFVPFLSPDDVRAALPATVGHLRSGGIVAYPTETVYGLGCLLRHDALERLASIKGRADDKPFLVLVGTETDLAGVSWPDPARRLADAFWPGPLTLALPVASGTFHPRVVGPGNTVAVRKTSHPAVRELLLALREPLTSTSANAAGAPAALTAADAAAVLRGAGAADAWILDGGTLAASQPSTLVDCSVQPPRLVREGAIPLGDLAKVVRVNG